MGPNDAALAERRGYQFASIRAATLPQRRGFVYACYYAAIGVARLET